MNALNRTFVFPWLPVAGALLLAWLLAGCSALKVKACLPGAEECSTIKISGESSLEEPVIIYERELPDGTIIRFRFGAQSSNRKGNTVDQVIAEAIVDRLLNPTGASQ